MIAYQWTCPLCSARRQGLSTKSPTPANDPARVALLSHVRALDGGGHGPVGRIPPDLDAVNLEDYVEYGSEREESTRPEPSLDRPSL